MAGGGVKGGTHYGETDDIGHKTAVDKVSVRDVHATLLHALGLDHEKLFPFQGLDQRLTSVEKARGKRNLRLTTVDPQVVERWAGANETGWQIRASSFRTCSMSCRRRKRTEPLSYFEAGFAAPPEFRSGFDDCLTGVSSKARGSPRNKAFATI
jgi:hypothetical protein